jgi:hypothetical protein
MGARMWKGLLVGMLALTSISACSGGGGEGPKSAISEDEIKKAVSVAKAIRKNPAGSEAALASAGMTHDELEALMWKIALDEQASQAYAKAMTRKAPAGEAPPAAAPAP